MSKGIYKCGNTYAYAMDLEKKLKRKKNAEIVEICNEDLNESELQLCLNKYLVIEKAQEDSKDVLLHHFKNVVTNETLTSIYSDLRNIPNIKLEEWRNID